MQPSMLSIVFGITAREEFEALKLITGA